MKKPFMAVATTHSGRFVSFDFMSYIDTPMENALVDPVLAAGFGEQVDCGALTAYCLRRFGLPNTGSDPYKDLASWLVSTPRDDVLLMISPHPNKKPMFSFRPFLARETSRALNHYEDIVGRRLRSRDLSTWSDGDPLKGCAEAVIATLRDLKRAVAVRDQDIGPSGLLKESFDDERSSALYCEAAAYPFGRFINDDPKAMAALVGDLVKLGGGDFAVGLAHAREMVKAALDEKAALDPADATPAP